MINNKDSLSIRYAQGMGIIAVVLGHYSIKPLDVMHPYVFHMPLFYFIGGLLFKEKPFLSLIKAIAKKHMLYLAYTYIVISAIAITLRETLYVWVGNIYPEKAIDSLRWVLEHNFHNNNYFLVAWFLFSYALISLICRFILQIKKKPVLLIAAISMGFVGMTYVSQTYSETKLQTYNLACQVMVGSMFYLLGYIFKGNILSLRSPYIPVAAVAILFTMKNFGILLGLGMSWSSYPHGFMAHTANSMLCIISIFVITNNIASSHNKLKALSIIGGESKVIMSYHLLAFTFVDYIFYKLGAYDIEKTTALKHFANSHFWYLYPVSGILLPIMLIKATRYIRSASIDMAKGLQRQ